MSKPSTRQNQVIAVVLGAIAVLVLAWAAAAADRTTLLIGLTGLALFLVIAVYLFVAVRYARRSLRAAVGLAAGWMLLPLLLYAAVVLAWGSPGRGSPVIPPPPGHESRTVIVYRNGMEVDRYIEGGSPWWKGLGNGLGLALVVFCPTWIGLAAILVYVGYKSQPGHSKAPNVQGGDPAPPLR